MEMIDPTKRTRLDAAFAELGKTRKHRDYTERYSYLDDGVAERRAIAKVDAARNEYHAAHADLYGYRYGYGL